MTSGYPPSSATPIEKLTGAGAGLVEQHGDALRPFERPLVEAVFTEFQSKCDDLLLLVMIDVIIAKHVAQLPIHTVYSILFGSLWSVLSLRSVQLGRRTCTGREPFVHRS